TQFYPSSAQSTRKTKSSNIFMHPPRTANTLAKQCRATLKPKVTGDCYHKHRLFYNVDFKHYSNYQGDESSDEHHRGRTRVQPACPDCCHWLSPCRHLRSCPSGEICAGRPASPV